MATVSLAKLAISVVANTKSAVKDLTGLEQTSKKLRKQFGTLEAGSITLAGSMAVLAGAGGIALVSKQLFELGSAAGETQSKFDTVFGAASDSAQEFIDDFATMAGLSRTAAQDVLATTGAIGQGMGMAQAASAAFAQQAVELAGDLSSFNNIPVAETAHAIQAAVTGEREQLKRLGIVISEADVKQRALAMSGWDVQKAMTQEAKAAATMSIISEKAGVAIGDLARTQDSAANRARQLGAQFANVKEALATALLPAFEVFLGELGGGVGGMEKFTDSLRGSGPVVAAWARVAVESFKFTFDAIHLVIGAAFNLGESIGGVVRAAFQLLRGDISAAKETLAGAAAQFGETRDLGLELAGSFVDIQNASGMAFEAMAEGATRAALGISELNNQLAGGDGGGLTAAQQRLVGMNLEFRDMSAHLTGIEPFLIELPEKIEPIARGMGDVVAEGNEFARVFAEAATSSGLSFKRFASTVISEMQRIALKKAALKIFDFMAGGPLSSFAGLFDQGGRIPAGQVGIVGERGPELVRGPANVTGREETAAMASGGGTILNIALVAADTGQVVDSVRYQTDRDEQKGREVRVPLRATVVSR